MLPNSGLISMHDILVEMGYDPSLPMDLRLRKVNERKQVWINNDWRNLNMCSPKTPKDIPPFNLMDWYEYNHTTKQECCALIEDFSNNSRGWYSANIGSVVFNNGVVELSGLGTSEPRFGINSVSPNPGISFNPRDYNYVVVRMRAASFTGGTQGIFFFGSTDIGGQFVSRPYSIGTTFEDYIFDFSTTPEWLNEPIIRNFAIGLPNNGPNIFIESFTICNKENLPVYTPVRIVGELFGPEIVGTGDDYQYNLVVRNTGATATTGTTTIKVFFSPTSGITYRTTTASGWTYSFSSGVLTITTSNILNPGFSVNLPILVTGTTQGTYQISGKVWTVGDPVASTESTARDTNQLQTVVTDNPPCIGLSGLQMNGDSLVNQDSQNSYSVNYSGSTRGITFNWTVQSGTGATITSGQGTSAVTVSFNFSSINSSIVLRCTITNLCSSSFVDITVSPRQYGNTPQSKSYTSGRCSPTQIAGTWVLTVPENTYTDFTVNAANQQAIDYLNSSTAQSVAESQMAAAGVECFASCDNINSVDAVLRLNGSVVPFSNVEFGVTYEILASVSGGSNVSYNWEFSGVTPVNIVGASAFVKFNFNDTNVPSTGGPSYSNASFTVTARNGCNSSSAYKIQTVTPLLFSASDTRTYVRNNCPIGQSPVGSITDTVTYSAVTQARANEGLQILINNRQDLANSQLSCQVVNVGNDVRSGSFERNNCGGCATSNGSVSYTVQADTHFAPTKDQANALAFDTLISEGQAKANNELGCSAIPVNLNVSQPSGTRIFAAVGSEFSEVKSTPTTIYTALFDNSISCAGSINNYGNYQSGDAVTWNTGFDYVLVYTLDKHVRPELVPSIPSGIGSTRVSGYLDILIGGSFPSRAFSYDTFVGSTRFDLGFVLLSFSNPIGSFPNSRYSSITAQFPSHFVNPNIAFGVEVMNNGSWVEVMNIISGSLNSTSITRSISSPPDALNIINSTALVRLSFGLISPVVVSSFHQANINLVAF